MELHVRQNLLVRLCRVARSRVPNCSLKGEITMIRKTLVCIGLGITLASGSRASNGQDILRYSPRRPTISPYLNLLRNDNGTLPNYYSLVRPQLYQQSFDNRILMANRAQERAVQRLSDVTSAETTGPTGSGSTFGNLSHFGNRSHFYQVKETYPVRQNRFGNRR